MTVLLCRYRIIVLSEFKRGQIIDVENFFILLNFLNNCGSYITCVMQVCEFRFNGFTFIQPVYNDLCMFYYSIFENVFKCSIITP